MVPAKRNRNNYLTKIENSLFETTLNSDQEIDIIITIDNFDIGFRDFSAFLVVVDHFYGRSYRKGFQSYSMTERAHLRAFEIRQGSIEIVIADILKNLSVENAIYFYLLIKYLPSALKSISEATLNASETFYNYERAQLVRKVRKNLRKELISDEFLENLSDDEIFKLAAKLQKKYDLERKQIYKASAFADKKMKAIKVYKRIKNKL